MEALDALGRRYGKRPSEIVEERNPYVALAIDLSAMKFGVAAEKVAAMKARQKRRR